MSSSRISEDSTCLCSCLLPGALHTQYHVFTSSPLPQPLSPHLCLSFALPEVIWEVELGKTPLCGGKKGDQHSRDSGGGPAGGRMVMRISRSP